GAAAGGGAEATGARPRGRDGEDADREPRRQVGPEALPRPLPHRVARPAAEESQGQAVAGAEGGRGRRGHRPDGGAPPVGRRDKETEGKAQGSRKAQSFLSDVAQR